MPISLTLDKTKICNLSEWSIDKGSRGRLVEILAYLYLQQEENAQRVINTLGTKPRSPKGSIVNNVIKKLTAPKQGDVEATKSGTDKEKEAAQKRIDTSIWHRDGLLFQHISWIVARQAMPDGHMTSPHVRQADKGFDGFIIELDESQQQVERIILCEDKASEDPRPLIRKSVWPEIRSIISGDRDDEILADLTTLLKGIPAIDAESAVDEIFWEGARHFRVSVATGEDKRKSKRFVHIVKGFDDVVTGTVEKRVAGVLPFDDVRKGLHLLAQEVIAKVGVLTGV
jgi:hypothetical protein